MKKLIDKYVTEMFKGRKFWGQGKKYAKTKFQAGTKYIVDAIENKMILIPSEEGNKTVSNRGDDYPVIDIKSFQAIKDKEKRAQIEKVFAGANQLQITIYEDEIVVEALTAEGTRENNVTDIRSKTQSKMTSKGKVVISKRAYEQIARMSKASGGSYYQSVSLFDFEWEETDETSTGTVIEISKALMDISIPSTLLSFFSGAGLWDYSFKQAGFTIEMAVEIDKDACDTYRKNVGNEVKCEDITKLDYSTLPKSTVMIGGTSCKPFSNVNRNTRLEDHPDYFLTHSFLDAVKANEACKVMVIENVEPYLTIGNGFFLKTIKERLPDFEFRYGVLNAAMFGDPQYRKRAFIIGTRGIDPIELPKPLLTEERQYKTVGEALEGLTSDVPNQTDRTNSGDDVIERMKYVRQGHNWQDIPKELRPKCQQSNYHLRLDPNKPSCTIVHPRKSLLTSPYEHAVISVREAARIMSLPDTFVFPGKGKLNAHYQQICNGVPIKLGSAIATVIKHAIEKFNISNRKELALF